MKVTSRKDGENLVIELTFDKHDQICLEHDLIDIVEWYSKGPSSEKIHSCRKRMIQENKDKLMNHPSMANKTLSEINKILNDPVACCKAIKDFPDYKNRIQRETE